MQYKGQVIHHSTSPDVSANEIDRWHKERGWNSIGYHFVIRKDGTIEPAREWNKVGAHAKGYNNTHIGICLTGNFNKYKPTQEQIDSLIKLSKGLISRFDANDIRQHHEKCPGKYFPWEEFIKEVL